MSGDFFSMGGYALYVWGAYAVTAVVLVGLAVLSWQRLRSVETALRLLEQVRRPRARRASATPEPPDSSA